MLSPASDHYLRVSCARADSRSARWDRRARIALLTWLAGSVALTAHPAAALHELEPEESISELLVEHVDEEREAHETEEGENKAEEELSRRSWAVVPQIGYGPETSAVVGVKFTDRDLLSTGVTLDLDGTYAIEGQQGYTVTVASPKSFGPDFPIIGRIYYKLDPVRRFYGLGNNTQGPDPASSHQLQRFGGDLTLGWRVLHNLSLNVQAAGLRGDVQIGNEVEDAPQTQVRFPDLPGINGATLIPFAASLVYDDRDGFVRPTRGWRILLKASYTVGDFHFARFLGDVSYLYPLFGQRLVLGGRVGAHGVAGSFNKIPFWTLPDLGGEDTMRGYFPYRFLGTTSLLSTLEARVNLFSFDFFDLWRVGVDGVGFGEIGRVFVPDADLAAQGGDQGSLAQTSRVPISYGGGIRFAVSEAILARVDVGFSNEETALVYLTFGHTF